MSVEPKRVSSILLTASVAGAIAILVGPPWLRGVFTAVALCSILICALVVVFIEGSSSFFARLRNARFSLQKLMIVMLWGCSGVSCVLAKGSKLVQALGFFVLAALVAYLIVAFTRIKIPFSRVRRDK